MAHQACPCPCCPLVCPCHHLVRSLPPCQWHLLMAWVLLRGLQHRRRQLGWLHRGPLQGLHHQQQQQHLALAAETCCLRVGYRVVTLLVSLRSHDLHVNEQSTGARSSEERVSWSTVAFSVFKSKNTAPGQTHCVLVLRRDCTASRTVLTLHLCNFRLLNP